MFCPNFPLLIAGIGFARPISDPVATFLVILGIMLVAPLVFERLRLPGIVGLILAGVVVGPYGLGILERDESIVLLGTIGLLFLMFMAGLETSLDDLKANANKALVFGLATFLVPMVIGTVAMLALGYGMLAAILVASCFASHTLLALPVLSKLGIMRSPAVTATLGATLITNVLALLVLAVVVKAHGGDLTLSFWLFLIPALAIYTFASLWGIPRLGRWFFRRFGHDESAEFIFVLATLFIISYLASLIEIEPIIGAFLAGIALTPLIPQLSPLMNRIQFIGNTLFVPFFLISVGMLIDPLILIKQPQSLLVAGVMIGAEVSSKYLAAWGCGKWFKFKMPSIMVMFGLSVAQAASTLAAITVAYDIELVDQLTVNGIIAMILVTCIASPWITERWGVAISPTEQATPQQSQTQPLARRVLVPVANPSTEDNLLNLALILTKASEGTLLPLHVITDKGKPISPAERTEQAQLLNTAEQLAHATVASVEPVGRIDGTIDGGIVRTAIEHEASLIICGWKGYSTYQENFFGSVIDNVVRRASVPVLITRFTEPIENLDRVLLAVTERQARSKRFEATLNLAQQLAVALKANLQVLKVDPSRKRRQLPVSALVAQPEISVIETKGRLVEQVSTRLQPQDLLILESGFSPVLRRNSAVGKEPEIITRSHADLSVVVIHFPL